MIAVHLLFPGIDQFSHGSVAHKSLVNGSNLKTTEQMEMERIEEAKKALEKSRQMSQHSLQMVRASRSYTPTKSIQPPTKPHEFRFKTDNRLKFTKEQEREKEELEKQRKARVRDHLVLTFLISCFFFPRRRTLLFHELLLMQ